MLTVHEILVPVLPAKKEANTEVQHLSSEQMLNRSRIEVLACSIKLSRRLN